MAALPGRAEKRERDLMLKTPGEKHMEMLERELARHALGEGTGQASGEAFRRGLEAMPRTQALFRVDPRIDPAGESAELTLAPGAELLESIKVALSAE